MKDFDRWCYPKAILVLMRASDDPAQVLWAMRQAEMTPVAKVVLAQLDDNSLDLSQRPQPAAPSSSRVLHPSFGGDRGRSAMWAEIMRRSFVLHGVSMKEIPGMIEAFKIDRVIATSSRKISGASRSELEPRLISSLRVPLWVLGRGMSLTLQTPEPPRRILVPASEKTDTDTVLRLAWGLGSPQRAVITVLHVFERLDGKIPTFPRTPHTVKSWLSLPLSGVQGTDCSLEIVVREGDAAAKILEFNARNPHDLVVLRCSSAPARRTSFSPTVFQRLCSEMPCPIAVMGSAFEPRTQPGLAMQQAATDRRPAA